MAFKFNMQKVLDFREQLEEEAKVRLGKAEYELRKGQARFAEIEKLYQQAQQDSAGKVMQSGERWLHEQYLKGLSADLKEAEMQLRMLMQLVEEARKILASRAMDRKILDKLKERKKIIFNKEELKQEQNFNDEIATIRYKAAPLEAC